MVVKWLLVVVLCLGPALARAPGSSLRSALEALQRRHRARAHEPRILPYGEEQDYDTVYELYPPLDAPDEVPSEDVSGRDPRRQYSVQLIDDEQPINPYGYYQYEVVKKKENHANVQKRKSAFRERTQHHADKDRLQDLFDEKNEKNDSDVTIVPLNDDAEYSAMLERLWAKYNDINNPRWVEPAPRGILALFKDRKPKVPKRKETDDMKYWGPVVFKKKRSLEDANDNNNEQVFDSDLEQSFKQLAELRRHNISARFSTNLNNGVKVSNGSPLAQDSHTIRKRFPVVKRSNSILKPAVKKRLSDSQSSLEEKRANLGTDPKVLQDLSLIFGETRNENIRKPVKRNTEKEEDSHKSKSPQMSVHQTEPHNQSEEYTLDDFHDENSQNLHDHDMHHPNSLRGTGIAQSNSPKEKPITVRKKSVNWSDYFGIDKRNRPKPDEISSDERMQKKYMDTFNEEVLRKKSKRNLLGKDIPKYRFSDNIKDEQAHKLDLMDNRLKKLEGLMVDDALKYSETEDELDSQEEQEMKEQLLSRLAAAYSLDKMRKALHELKQSFQSQRIPQDEVIEDAKDKRIAVKKEKAELPQESSSPISNYPPTELYYLDEKPFSEAYMGGSGGQHTSEIKIMKKSGQCPILDKIVQRCRGIDFLSGDRGQLFLPICSTHQVCYLCSNAVPTTCDLLFLSEADSLCDGEGACQRSARTALMAMRELHDTSMDDLDGECEANPCLVAALLRNDNWQQAYKR